MLTLDTIREAPKALLHDHLDGGLRPATVIDLAREHGYRDLPTEDVDELATWFRRGADRKSLELYLETFAHTFGVMQWPDAIRRCLRPSRTGWVAIRLPSSKICTSLASVCTSTIRFRVASGTL